MNKLSELNMEYILNCKTKTYLCEHLNATKKHIFFQKGMSKLVYLFHQMNAIIVKNKVAYESYCKRCT